MFEEADLIYSYTRADAIRDGVLIDVTATAQEAGIRWPVAVTCARERDAAFSPDMRDAKVVAWPLRMTRL